MRVVLVVCVLSWAGLAYLFGWGVAKALRGPDELILYRPWQLSEAGQWKLLETARKLVEAWDSWRLREAVGVDSGLAFSQLVDAEAELERSFGQRRR